MRDVLDGLEDAACYVGYQSVPDTLEILSIEPPGRESLYPREIVPLQPLFDNKRSSNIVEYLLTRELKKTA